MHPFSWGDNQNEAAGQKPQAAPLREWGIPWRWRDVAKANAGKIDFAPSRAEERRYERKLTSLAEQIDRIIHSGKSPEEITTALTEYGNTIEPWARQSATNMLFGVRRKNDQAWASLAKRAGRDMRELINAPGVGELVRERINANVQLIQSLVWQERDAVEKLITENISAGGRAEDIAAKISTMVNGSYARAKTIARTEVSKASTALTLVRAESVGSEGYIWRTARDGDTRPSHKAMEGKFVKWSEPVTLDGMTGHAGEFVNCRCYPEPVIPRENTPGVYKPPLPTAAAEQLAGEQQRISRWERTNESMIIRHVPGAPLVNAAKGNFDSKKLTHYSLNPLHPRGKHKAKVFKATIGATAEHADMIEQQVMAFLPYADKIVERHADFRGVRYNVFVPVTGPNGRTVDVRTAWIYDRFENGNISLKPRLTTIYVEEDSNAI